VFELNKQLKQQTHTTQTLFSCQRCTQGFGIGKNQCDLCSVFDLTLPVVWTPWPSEEQVSDLRERSESLQGRVTDLEDEVSELEGEVSELRQLVYQAAPTTADLSDRQKEAAGLWLADNKYRTRQELADELDISDGYAGTLLSKLKDELEFDTRVVNDKGKKAFRLEDSERQRITG